MVTETTWHEIRKRMEALTAGTEFGGAVSEATIVAAEAEIGAYPPEYRRFVAEFGWIEWGAVTVYGLGGGPGHIGVVGVTLSERLELEPGLDDGFIAIAPDGNGNVYCVAVGNEAPTTVLFRDHEAGHASPELYADSFDEWLLERLKWWNT